MIHLVEMLFNLSCMCLLMTFGGQWDARVLVVACFTLGSLSGWFFGVWRRLP